MAQSNNNNRSGSRSNTTLDPKAKTKRNKTALSTTVKPGNKPGKKPKSKADNKPKSQGIKPAGPKVAGTNKKVPKTVKKSRSQQLFSALTEKWDLKNIRPKNDDFIVDCISGKRTTDLSYWNALEIQRARTAASIDTKIKKASPIQSEEEAILEFISTQTEPVLSGIYANLVKKKIDEVFHLFPYEDVKSQVENLDRKPIITNGSAYPPIMAPIISGRNSNMQLIAAMAAGRDVFLSDFHVDEWVTGLADGRLIMVPKNYKKGRIITITSREFTNKQYPVSDALRDWITSWSRTSNHIIQFDDQTVQHSFLKEGYATLDLSSASDRVYRSLIEKVWPDFMKYFGEYLPKTVITAKGRVIPLTCIGTQGFPLTFTVMAIITGCIVAAVKTSKLPGGNYGDDIALPEVDFDETFCALEALGLKVNQRKSFKSSDGFLESCGRDVMFTKKGIREVTPIHLRGESDVEIIQFFYQLCSAELIDVLSATSIMDKLHVEYYAFDYEYQLTEFHLPFGEVKNLPERAWSYDDSHYVCKVPALKQEVSSIKGLSQRDSDMVLSLLHIEGALKDAQIGRLYVRKPDPVARPYALMDLQDSKLYSLYEKLDVAGSQVPEIFYSELEEKYKISFKAIMYYKFITSELRHYRFSTATVDFNDCKILDFDLQDLLDQVLGIKNDVKYPIFRYKVVKSFKTITHPSSNSKLDLD